MSEHLQNFEDFIKNLNDDLDTVDEKYPDEQESDNCAKCLEKLNIYTRYTMALINSKCYHSRDNVESQQSIPSPLCTDGNPKIQDDLNVVRNVLDNRIQLEEQAIDSLLEGKNRKIEF